MTDTFDDSSPRRPAERPTAVRYIVVALATLMSFLLYFHRGFPFFLLPNISSEFSLSDTGTALFASVFYWSYALGQVPSGWLNDRFGCRLMLTLYILTWSLFTCFLGLAPTFLFLLLTRLGAGLAQAGAYPTGASMVSKWVPFSARATASSLVMLGGRLGGALAPALTAPLLTILALATTAIPGRTSPILEHPWRAVTVIYGILGLVIALLFWWSVRDQPSVHPGCNAPEQQLIDEGRTEVTSPHGKARGLPLRYLLGSRSLWLSSISQFGTNFGWVFLVQLLPKYLKEVHHLNDDLNGLLSGMPLLVGMSGMLVGGWLTDRLTQLCGVRWGRRWPMALTRFLAMAAYLACLGLDSPWLLTVAFCLVAVATDLGTPSVWAFSQDIAGKHVGSVLGWGNMWGNLGAALSPLVLLSLQSGSGPEIWHYRFLTLAAAFAISGITALGVDATIPIVPMEKLSPGKSNGS